jgi:hypothetical protein
MLLGLTYQLIRFLTDLVLVRTRSDAQLRAQVLALRLQLRVLELLDHLLIFSARHLEAVIKDFLVHYHQARPHQGLEQRCPEPLVLAPVRLPVGRQMVRQDRLGGLLHEYSWAA